MCVKFRTLDVGCGDRPKGDVNCDLYVGNSPHFTDKSHGLINPKKIPNFVKCDAHFLPFKNNSFSVVVAYHVLEHCRHPFDVLNEFRRVSNHKVILEVPNISKVLAKESPTHLFTWSKDSLYNLMKKTFLEVKVYGLFLTIDGRDIKLQSLPLSKFFYKSILAVGLNKETAKRLPRSIKFLSFNKNFSISYHFMFKNMNIELKNSLR